MLHNIAKLMLMPHRATVNVSHSEQKKKKASSHGDRIYKHAVRVASLKIKRHKHIKPFSSRDAVS